MESAMVCCLRHVAALPGPTRPAKAIRVRVSA